MSTLKPIVKGRLVTQEEALAGLEKLADAPADPITDAPPIIQPVNLQNGLYLIDRPLIHQAAAPAY